MLLAPRHLQSPEGSVKSSAAEISRGRETDVSMECMPPPNRTEIEKKTKKGTETEVETEGVKQVNKKVTRIRSHTSNHFKGD